MRKAVTASRGRLTSHKRSPQHLQSRRGRSVESRRRRPKATCTSTRRPEMPLTKFEIHSQRPGHPHWGYAINYSIVCPTRYLPRAASRQPHRTAVVQWFREFKNRIPVLFLRIAQKASADSRGQRKCGPEPWHRRSLRTTGIRGMIWFREY